MGKVKSRIVPETHRATGLPLKGLGARRAVRFYRDVLPDVTLGSFSASWSFASIPVFSPELSNRTETRVPEVSPVLLSLRRKLLIGSINDPLEHEVDRVADRVMRVTDSAAVGTVSSRTANTFKQKCSRGGSCDKRQVKHGHQDGQLQMKRTGSDDMSREAAPPIVREVLRSPGQPLDAATRAFMEPRFGHDFSQIRVHSGEAAEQSARDVNANAYTMGHDIVFGAGRFAPGTYEGRRLLAHELTHAVRQASSAGRSIGQNDGNHCWSHVARLGSAGAQTVQRERTQEEEEQRDKDRRDRRSTDSRRNRQELGLADLFDNFDSDWAGRMILGQYLYGGGRKVEVRDDPAWTAYMTKSQRLRSQVWVQVIAAAKDLVQRGKAGRQPSLTRFHAEAENGEGIIGYQYLHGTNKDVGDFFVVGFGEVTQFQGPHSAVVPSQNPFGPPKLVQQGAGVRVDFELTFIWNDIIDPNGAYISDKIKSGLAYVFTLGQPENYQISIGWRNACSVWLPASGGQLVTGGYPAL